jgi:hypothetical protein
MKGKYIMVLMSIFYINSFAQNWRMDVQISGSPVCSSSNYKTSNSITGTFNGSVQKISNTQKQSPVDVLSYTIIDPNGNFPGGLHVTGSGNCWDVNNHSPEGGNALGDLSINHTSGNGDQCMVYTADFSNPDYHLSVYVVIYRPLGSPTIVNSGCSTGRVQITLPNQGTFKWWVSQDASTWYELIGKTSSVLDVSAIDLYRTGFTSPNRTIKVEDRNCYSRGFQTITFAINLKSSSATVTPTSPSCHGGTNGSILVDITPSDPIIKNFAVTIFNLSIPGDIGSNYNFTDAPGSINNLKAGTYKIQVENNTNPSVFGTCPVQYATNIIDPPSLNLSFISSTGVSCNINDISVAGKKQDGVVNLKVQNGNPSFLYSIASYNGSTYSGYSSIPSNDANSRNPVLSDIAKGQFKVKVTDSKFCTSNEVLGILVNEPSRLGIAEDSKTNVKCKDTNNGSGIAITPSGGNGGYVYNWNGSDYSSTDQDITNLYAGTYSLTITDSKGCSNSMYSATITQPATKLTILNSKSAYGSYNVSCLNNDGSIDISYQNKSYSITSYEWRKEEIIFSPEDPEHLKNLNQGNYSIKVSDANSCEATSSIFMSGNPGITGDAIATTNYNGYNVKCNSLASNEGEGKIIISNSFGMLRYEWSHDENLNSSIASDLKAGSYHVKVTDVNHCIFEDDLIITAPPPIFPHLRVTSNYNGAQISCAQLNDGRVEAFPVNGFGNYYYSWEHNSNLSAKFANGLAKGTYKVIIKDDYGCSAQESVAISDPPRMKFVFNKNSYNGSDISCFGKNDGGVQTTVLNGLGSASLFQYNWSNGALTRDISNLTKGSYKITVKDGNNCVKDSTVILTQPNEISLMMEHVNDFNGYDITCYGQSNGEAIVYPSGGTGSFSFIWSNGRTTINNPDLNAGNYSVVVTDVNGCKNSGSISVVQPSILTFSGSVDEPISCFGLSDGMVSLQGAGGVEPYYYSHDRTTWTTVNSFKELPFGNQSFYLKDANGCMNEMTENIPQPNPLQVSFSDMVNAACNDPVGSVKAVVTGGNGNFIYTWFNNESNEMMNTGISLVNAIAGIYRVDVEDSKKCEITDVTNISSIGGATFSIKNIVPVTCFGYDDGSALIEISSGVSPYSYSLSNGQTSNVASRLKAGKYFATVQDGLGCKTTAQFVIATPEALSSRYERKQPLCLGDCNGQIKSIAFGGTFPYSYEWINLNNITDELLNICAGNYDLKITDKNNCTFQDRIELKDPEVLQITAEVINPTCLGRCDGSIIVTGNGGTGLYSFQWQNQIVGNSINNLCASDNIVTMTDSNNCLINRMFSVSDGLPVSIDLGTKATLCVGQTKFLDAGLQWINPTWTSDNGFKSEEHSVVLKDPGTYFFKGTDDHSCIALDTFKLETSLDLLRAEFLMPSEAFVGDTLVAIDISWPLPEKIEWIIPSSFNILDSSANGILYAQLLQEGSFEVGMKSFLAECRDLRRKKINILTISDEAGGRLGFNEELIREFDLYPNPNKGLFTVKIELSQTKEIKLRVVQFPSGVILSESNQASSVSHNINFDLRDLPQGYYLLLISIDGQQRFIRFLKE